MYRQLWFFCACFALCLIPSIAWSQSDLVVESVKGIPTVVDPARPVTVSVCVRNQGAAAAGNFSVGLFFSVDKEVTTFDTKLVEATFPLVAVKSVVCQVLKFQLSQTSAASALGVHSIAAIADWSKKIRELDESNNTGKPFQTKISGPDLVVSVLSGLPSSPPKPGDSLTFRVCATNKGGKNAARSFSVGVFYSADRVISRFDTKLAEFSASSLLAGAQICRNMAFKLPTNANILSGFVGVFADFSGLVREEDEKNNTQSVALTPRPDLVVESLTGVATRASSGSKLSVTVCVKNDSKTDATKPFQAGVYYSDNDLITLSDTFLGSASFASLKQGQKACKVVNVTLPALTQLGDNWVGAFVDRTGQVDELDETNNFRSVKFINPAPDLIIKSLSGFPPVTKPGDSHTVSVCVTNDGAANATQSFKVFLYHSLDSTLTNNDTKLGEATFSSLGFKQTSCKNIKVTLQLMPIGRNFFGARVDVLNTVQEENENNNVRVNVFTNPSPDLVVFRIIGVPATASSGTSANVGVCVRNNGTSGATKAFKVTLYHSDNAQITQNDTRLGEKSITQLGKDQVQCLTFAVTLQKSYLVPGSNWIGAIVDRDNLIEEFDETNNNGNAKFATLSPDLVVSEFRGIPKGAVAGSSFYADVCVKNTGSEDVSGKFLVTVYYSLDPKISKGDTPVGVGTVSGLKRNTEACIVILVTLPSALQRGLSFVGAMVDSGEVIRELDETNNFSKNAAIQDSTLRIDLQIASITGLPSKANANDPINVTICVKNVDSSNSAAFKVGLYYSSDSILSIYKDTLLVSVSFANGVASNKTVCQQMSAKVPAKINQKPQGNWFGVAVDTEQQIPEVNKANNIKLVRFDDAGGLPDLVIDTIKSVPTQGLPGAEFKDVEICVRNVNRGVASPTFRLTMYYSKDKDIDINDHVMATYTFTKPILSSTSQCVKLKGKLPLEVKAGDAWLGAYVDPDESVQETKDDNNKKAQKFYINIADLTVEKISGVPKEVKAGDTITAKICIKNRGVKDSTAFKLGLYLEPDARGKKSKIHEISFPAGLKKDVESCKTYSFKLPGVLSPGTRTLEAWVDNEEVIREASEGNNKKTAEFLIAGPDLTVKTLELKPNTAKGGESVSVRVCVQNIGKLDLKDSFVVRIFDSPDDQITNSDTKLAEYTYSVSDLAKFKAKAKEDCRSVTVKVPAGLPEGRRYFGAFVEAAEKVAEEKEDNNTKAGAFVAPSTTKPNLVPVSIRSNVPQQQPGGTITVEVCVQNFGVTIPKSQDVQVGVYIAKNKTSTTALQIHKYAAIKGLAAQARQCLLAGIKLPSNMELGKVYLIGRADYENNIVEANEKDNQIEVEFFLFIDRDSDGIPAGLDCDDRDKNVYPAYLGKPAAKEICDKKDNDCSGKADEPFANLGKACEEGKGICKVKGKYVCNKDGSGMVCDRKPGQPTTEDCNGLDDDCDGKVDNEADKACFGGQFCVSGKCKLILCVTNSHCPSGLVCKEGYCQRPKNCSGGQSCDKLESCRAGLCIQKSCSQDSECEANSFCFGKVCVAACTLDINCGPNHICENGRCWKRCVNATDCHSSQACIRGQCQDKCTKKCLLRERCLLGQCVENSCHGYRCPNGQVCLKNNCVRDPCSEIKCGAGEFCVQRRCVKACSKTTCPSGQTCDSGSCRSSSCKDVQCKKEEICLLGKCHPRTCSDGACGKGRFCVNNKCQDDLCSLVSCPDPQKEVCETDDQGQPQCVLKNKKPPVEEPQEEKPESKEPTTSTKDAGPDRLTPEKEEEVDSYVPTPDFTFPKPDQGVSGCTCNQTSSPSLPEVILMLLFGFLFLSRRRA